MNNLQITNKEQGLFVLRENEKIILECLNNFKNKISQEMLDAIYQNYLLNTQNDFNCVYFIRNKYSGLVKIGSTKNIVRRYKELDSLAKNYLGMENSLVLEGLLYVPFGINPSNYEKQIHSELMDCRKFGEWFDISYDNIIFQYFNSTYDFYDGVCVTSVDVRDVDKDVSKFYKFNIDKKSQNVNIKKITTQCSFDLSYKQSFLLEDDLLKNILTEYFKDSVNPSLLEFGHFCIDDCILYKIYFWLKNKPNILNTDVLINKIIKENMVGIVEKLRKSI